MNRKEAESKLAVAEARRREAQERIEENAQRLARLEEERVDLLGDSAIAQRGVADFDAYLESIQEELAAIEVDEAHAAFKAAVRERDEALERAAEAVEGLVAAVNRIAAARESVCDTHRRLGTLDPAAPPLVPPEPKIFDEPWQDLAPLVESELDRRLESQIVEAAVQSPNLLVIDQLPEHLRELAWQRKRERKRDAARRTAT